MSWDREDITRETLCFPYRKETLKVRNKKVEDTLVLCSYSCVQRTGKIYVKIEKKSKDSFQAVTIVRRKGIFPGWKV